MEFWEKKEILALTSEYSIFSNFVTCVEFNALPDHLYFATL